MQLVLDLIPQRRLAQRLFDFIAHRTLVAIEAQAKRDVAIDTHCEGIRLLENHPDVTPHRNRIDAGFVDVLAAKDHVSAEMETAHQIVHPIEASQRRALAASGGPDEGGDGALLDLQRDIADRLEL